MDPEESQAALPDAASPEFDAAVRAGQFDAEAEPESVAGEGGEATPFQAALDELDGKPAAEAPPKTEATPEERPQEQAPPPEDWKRKAESYAGNNRQLQALVAQERQRAAQMEQRIAQIEQQAQQERDIAQIRQAVPAELQPEAIADYQRRRAAGEEQQGMEAYRGFLVQQQQQIAQAQQAIFHQGFVNDLPNFLGFVAERAQAPVEPLLEVAKTPAFQEALGALEGQADYDKFAGFLLAFAQVEAKKDQGRKETNRLQAVQAGTHREVSAGAGGSGGTGQDIQARMNGMSDAQFIKFAESVRRAGAIPR